jgi:hypothetical protein
MELISMGPRPHKDTIVCEQVVYTSKDTKNEKGYQIIANSPGLSPTELKQIQENSTISGLIPFDYSFSEATRYYILPNKKVCCARMINAGQDSMGRPNRIHTHTLVFEKEQFSTILNNPFLIERYLEDSILQKERYEEVIGPLEISMDDKVFDYSVIGDLKNVIKTRKYLNGLLSAVIKEKRIYILMDTQRDEKNILYTVINCFPANLRPKCTFSTFTMSPENELFNIVISPLKAINFSEYTINDDYWVINLKNDYLRDIDRSEYAKFISQNLFKKNYTLVQSHISAMEHLSGDHNVTISFQNIDTVHKYILNKNKVSSIKDMEKKVRAIKKCAKLAERDIKSNSVAIDDYIEAITVYENQDEYASKDIIAELYLSLLNTMIIEGDMRILRYFKKGLLCFESNCDLESIRTVIKKVPEIKSNNEILDQYQDFLGSIITPERIDRQKPKDIVSLFITTFTVFKKADYKMNRNTYIDICKWGYEKSGKLKKNERIYFLKGCMDTIPSGLEPKAEIKELFKIFDYPTKSLDWKYQLLISILKVTEQKERYGNMEIEIFREGYNILNKKDRPKAKYFIDRYNSYIENIIKPVDKTKYYDEIHDMYLTIDDYNSSMNVLKKKALDQIKTRNYTEAEEAITELAKFGIEKDFVEVHKHVFELMSQFKKEKRNKQLSTISRNILNIVPTKKEYNDIFDQYIENLLSSTMKIQMDIGSIESIINNYELILTKSRGANIESNRKKIKTSAFHTFLNHLLEERDISKAQNNFSMIISFYLKNYGDVPFKIRKAMESYFTHMLSSGNFNTLDEFIYELTLINEKESMRKDQRFEELLRSYAIKLYKEWIKKSGLKKFIEDRPIYEKK